MKRNLPVTFQKTGLSLQGWEPPSKAAPQPGGILASLPRDVVWPVLRGDLCQSMLCVLLKGDKYRSCYDLKQL